MAITQLRVTNFRNITSARLDLGDRLNFITGPNASGKSSLIEAIYVLSRAQSFRTHLLRSVVQRDRDSATVYARLEKDTATARSRSIAIGIHQGRCEARVDTDPVRRLSDLTRALPIQLLTPRSYELLTSGPKNRRRLLLWGLFHVELDFLGVYRRYMTALSQRNAALRQGLNAQQFRPWDRQLGALAETIREHSSAYVHRLQHHLGDKLASLLPGYRVELIYRPGWDTTKSLQSLLQHELGKDREAGYTRMGPQRADLRILLDGQPIERFASNGQQKLIVLAILLSQGAVYREFSGGEGPVLLMDDFAAELDEENRQRVLDLIDQDHNQCLATGLGTPPPEDLPEGSVMFHVEHGMFHVEQ